MDEIERQETGTPADRAYADLSSMIGLDDHSVFYFPTWQELQEAEASLHQYDRPMVIIGGGSIPDRQVSVECSLFAYYGTDQGKLPVRSLYTVAGERVSSSNPVLVPPQYEARIGNNMKTLVEAGRQRWEANDGLRPALRGRLITHPGDIVGKA